VVVPNQSSDNVSILLGTGTGSFGPVTNITAGVGPFAVVIADFNGDGKPDLAVTNRFGFSLSIRLGTGTGSFGSPTHISTAAQPFGLASGDIDGDGNLDLAVAAQSNNVSIYLGTGAGSFGSATNFPVGMVPVSVSIADLNGSGQLDLAVPNLASDSVSVLINGPLDALGPLTTGVLVSPTPVAVNAGITLTATVDDSTKGGSAIASAHYTINGGPPVSMTAQDMVFDSVVEPVTATIGGFATPDVKEACVDGTDVNGNTGPASCAFLVIYDPNGGFVTGGGWITSPPGAYVANASLTGRADFGFVSRYHPGASLPSGNSEFQFQLAALKFKSTSYEWLVVAGAKAQYKGVGTINGAGNFGFMITALDGNLLPGFTDRFRIKIWDKNSGDAIVYDNEIGVPDGDNPSAALGGGSVIIHK